MKKYEDCPNLKLTVRKWGAIVAINTHNHPNSIAAGERHPKTKSRTDRRAICALAAARESEGVIEEEILRNCPDIHHNALRLRLGELTSVYKFLTLGAGERRKNINGNYCRVFHITDAGLRALGLPLTRWHVPLEAVEELK